MDLDAFLCQELQRHEQIHDVSDRFIYKNVVIGAKVTVKTAPIGIGFQSDFIIGGGGSSSGINLETIILDCCALLPQSQGRKDEILWLVDHSNFLHHQENMEEQKQHEWDVECCLHTLVYRKKLKLAKNGTCFYMDFMPDFCGTRFCWVQCNICHNLDPFRSQRFSCISTGEVIYAQHNAECTTSYYAYKMVCTICGISYAGGSSQNLCNRTKGHLNIQKSGVRHHILCCSGHFIVRVTETTTSDSYCLLVTELKWHRILQANWPDGLSDDFSPSLL